MRLFIVFMAIVALVWSGLHAGPVAAHESDAVQWAHGGVHAHGHDQRDDGNHGVDAKSDQGHQHPPSCAAPQFAPAGLERDFHKQAVFPSEASLLRLGANAPPLDPPIA